MGGGGILCETVCLGILFGILSIVLVYFLHFKYFLVYVCLYFLGFFSVSF